MPVVHLDITGMYFRMEVTVDDGATVKDVMEAAMAASAGGAANGMPSFTYLEEDYQSGPKGKTVNTITVVHRNGSAMSGQNGGRTGRVYDNGVYSFSDDALTPPVAGAPIGPLVPLDPNQNNVRSWQYYVYDAKGTDQARTSKDGVRTIVPFNLPAAEGGYSLTEGCTVVWRLVTIFTRPTHEDYSAVPKRILDGAARV